MSNMYLVYVNISNSKNEWPTLGYHSYINSHNNIISILWLVNKQNWQSVTVVLRPHQHNALYILNYSKSFCPRYNLHESGSPLFYNSIQSGRIWKCRLDLLEWTEQILKTNLFINLAVIIILSFLVCTIEQVHPIIPQTFPSSFEFICVVLHPQLFPLELIIIVTCWSEFKEYSLPLLPLWK